MIGYLFPDKSKLTLPQRKIFRDYYCSLCLSIKYKYGNLMRVFVSYDIAILMMISDYGICIEDCGRCGHRIKNRRTKFLTYEFSVFADISMTLIRKKIEDDLKDHNLVRACFLSAVCKRAVQKSSRTNKRLNELADEYFARYTQFEKVQDKRCPDSAAVALTYGRCMGELFQRILALSDERTRLLAGICAWTLLADSLDDYDKDLKCNSFNVFGQEYPSRQLLLIERQTVIRSYFNSLFEELEDAFQYVDLGSRANIILNNLIRYGMRSTTETLLQGQKIKKQKLL